MGVYTLGQGDIFRSKYLMGDTNDLPPQRRNDDVPRAAPVLRSASETLSFKAKNYALKSFAPDELRTLLKSRSRLGGGGANFLAKPYSLRRSSPPPSYMLDTVGIRWNRCV